MSGNTAEWVQAIAAIVTMAAAVAGVGLWQYQLRGETEHKTALNLVRVAISACAALRGAMHMLARHGNNRAPATALIKDAASDIGKAGDAIDVAVVEVRAAMGKREALAIDDLPVYAAFWSWLLTSYAERPLPKYDDGTPVSDEYMRALQGDSQAIHIHVDRVDHLLERVEQWAEPYLRRKIGPWERSVPETTIAPYEIPDSERDHPGKYLATFAALIDADLRRTRRNRRRFVD